MTLIANIEVVCFRVISNNRKLKLSRKLFFSKFRPKSKRLSLFQNKNFRSNNDSSLIFFYEIVHLNPNLAIFTQNRPFHPKSVILIESSLFLIIQKLVWSKSIFDLRQNVKWPFSVLKIYVVTLLRNQCFDTLWKNVWRSCMRILNPIRTKNVPDLFNNCSIICSKKFWWENLLMNPRQLRIWHLRLI